MSSMDTKNLLCYLTTRAKQAVTAKKFPQTSQLTLRNMQIERAWVILNTSMTLLHNVFSRFP